MLPKIIVIFSNRLEQNEISPDELFKAISKLIIVDIELKKLEDDPQLIFESLNSTGLSLSQSDLVRNYILMKETLEKQNLYYDKYWHKIEIYTNYRADNFIRDYLTYKLSSIPKKEEVYISFKNYVEEKKKNTDFEMEDFLKELLKFSKYYSYIINTKYENYQITELLVEIVKLDMTVCYPFLLEVFNDVEEGLINNKNLKEILEILIAYTFRRTICEASTNALNKIFMVLGREIKKHQNLESHYVDTLKYILINKKATQRFPDDSEFQNKLSIKDIYSMQSKNIHHLLGFLENYENKEKVDIENLLADKLLSIEHIMPLTYYWELNPYWI